MPHLIRLIRRLAAGAGLAAALFAGLSTDAAAATASGDNLIRRVEVTEDFFTLYLDHNVANEGCAYFSTIVYWRSDFPKGFNALLATAIAAQAQGKTVTMWLSGCKMGPWGSTLPLATSLVITDH